MQRYGDDGYAYSFQKVQPLLSENSFNIVNSECVLSPVCDKMQQTGKYLDFVLGANPEKTVKCYKDVNINSVMLANNHMMDFGQVGCRQTREYFLQANLFPFGAGKNADEAECPLCLKTQNKQIIVFNSYCFFAENRYKFFNHYCFGSNTGTSYFGIDFDVSLAERIQYYRRKYPNAFIIMSPHWSTDFNSGHRHLRGIAEKMFDNGVDLILGHGPHIAIGAEHIKGKLCVYSLGNFVFNTTGIDLNESGKLSYGIAAKIILADNVTLKLYPIYTNNLKTFFQPHPINQDRGFDEFLSSFIGRNKFEAGKDDIGSYLTVKL
jgi:poly-gamma-glutamate capsule biosynthesis protein CapA/YwtB (metallophosphatase superfamily)